ncbi:MAG TPA: malto-oligosyltrehalose trehalohydrolase [Flavisolibacter sp.]|nr:malto-oligosyltrehalose trehalohydrolase [Flavisolibacter sp.]
MKTEQNNAMQFSVWAPAKKEMRLHIVSPFNRLFSMEKDEWGNFTVTIENIKGPLRYFYQQEDGREFPDPASPFQPEGVHGPSETVDHGSFAWHDKDWKGIRLEEAVLYELHVGTFTPEGTFEAIIPRLEALKEAGINTIELMPVAQFPGSRNWGYDGAYPYAVQNSYGGPQGLKTLVDACHQKGIAVWLDVVYNHIGPEGAYLSQFGPYFTDTYCTPWGDAINYDGEWSDGVRDYFSNNALYWFEHYHIDGLRCDAVHTVFDNGAVHFWQYTSEKVKALEQKLGRRLHLVAESDLNSPKVITSPELGGYGFDGQWLDDFHHALYVKLNPEDKDRYYDFGSMEQVVKAYNEGFVHSGEWVRFRKRKHGASSKGIPGNRFIAFNLNHDQVGNRAGGERLCMLVNFERVKLAAAALFLSPYVPMLFMGEEYADNTPFFYFISHSDEELIRAVQKGRREEFKDYGFEGEIPDPQDEQTFLRSKVHWEKRNAPDHQTILQWHKALMGLRQNKTPLKNFSKNDCRAEVISEDAFLLVRKALESEEKLACFFNLSEAAIDVVIPEELTGSTKLLDSKDARWLQENTAPDYRQHLLVLEKAATFHLLPLSVVVYAK